MLGWERLERLLAGLAVLLPNAPVEYTIEANPESADKAFFEVCADHGVNRISLGVQTFHEPSRRAVNRRGTALLVQRSLDRARSFFPAAFSIDLIAGLPSQDEAVLHTDIARALAFAPSHVSLYSLILDEHTPLWEKWEKMGKREKREKGDATFGCERIDQLWLAGRDALERNGYVQYEVSNFCQIGETDGAGETSDWYAFMSAHNLRYWRLKNWLGIGAAASGTTIDDETGTGVRQTVLADVDAYLKDTVVDVERLDSLTLIKETFLMGFRTVFGPDRTLFQNRFHRDIETCIPRTIASWRDKGFFERERLRLTRTGLLFLDTFLRESFSELAYMTEY
jgi:oxygen-independent coproporphyrinogen-3 oxidase